MSLDSHLVTLAATAHKLVEYDLIRGNAGNVSVRWRDLCYISPAGAQLDRLSAADFVPLNINGENTWQLQRASSESRLHLACYQARAGVGAVFHVRPPNCLALGCAGLELRAITPGFHLAVGEKVPLLPYITPTTQQLADAVGKLVEEHDAVLLRNNGLVLTAADPEAALAHILTVEEAARVVLLAQAASGSCSYLSTEDIKDLERETGRYHR